MTQLPNCNEGKVIIFSDVHLGTPTCNRYAFRKFVDWLVENPPYMLIILGDLLDFWRRNNAEVLLENKEVLDRLFSVKTEIIYVVGNHDYAIWDTAQRGDNGGKPSVVKDLRFKVYDEHRETWYYCTHGYDLDVAVTMEGMPLEVYEAFAAAQCRAGDGLGSLASLLWDGISLAGSGVSKLLKTGSAKPHNDLEYDTIYQVAVSGTAHLLCGAHPGDRIVSGHTHWPFITKDQSAANTGSWCTEAGVKMHNTYIEIAQDGMKLKTFSQ
ncbi:MAG: metallophosphoesterase [Methanoregula sp.]|nr:metallophosphoesterase [Methanoregula sp.]